MEEVYSIPLSELCAEFSLEKVYVPDNFDSIMVTTPEISRPGLALAGFFEIFEAARVQIIGYAEYRYLETLSPEVWGEPYLPSSSNTVIVHIANLRRKLEKDPSSPALIRTVWGKGYRID